MRNINLLLDSNRGVFIPRDFATLYLDPEMTHLTIKPECVPLVNRCKPVISDPNNEWYWDSWDELIDGLILVDRSGNEWGLFQNGDLWIYRISAIDTDEVTSLFDA